MPLHIAVILCTWNRAASLRVTLDSLRGQQIDGSTAVSFIVMDNNSNDDTRAVVEAARSDWPVGQLHYRFEGRQGKQFALNSGIDFARSLGCELLLFSDDDILFPPRWCQQAAGFFQDPHVMLIGGKTLLDWPPAGPPAWFHRNMAAILAGVDLGDRRLDPPDSTYAPAGSNMAARVGLFDQVGGFSEAHFRHMDYEFGQRCMKRGVYVTYEPDWVVRAPVDPQLLTRRYFRRWSLKAGISPWQDMQPGIRHLGWVPLWLYRQIVQDCLVWLVAPLRGESPDSRFLRELRIWRGWGTVASRWISRLRPSAYPAWVKARSQKRKDVY
ncbi:glycosyltransferase family 2 protein [Roseateles sp. BYS87W]|uniref:Glycosyltransferase family 2 protein n=1 Tax=Pelomonas baiyunensis TaxID=3299026 RepID=A0ABW7GWT6_9BURK